MQAAPRPPGGAAEGQPVQAVRSGAAQDGLVPGTADICTKNIFEGRQIFINAMLQVYKAASTNWMKNIPRLVSRPEVKA